VEPPHGDDKPHLPSPSIWPVGFAVGIACTLVGLVVSRPAAIAGVVIAIAFGTLWARDAMRASRAPAVDAEAAPEGLAAPAVDGEPDEVERYPRNKFLELSTLGLGGVITAVVALPVIGFAVLPAFTDQEQATVDLGPMDNFPEGQWIETTFTLDPTLGEVSRRTAFVRYNGLLHDLPSFTLISNRCVHLGCPVQASGPRNDNQKKIVKTPKAELSLTPILPANFSCPCHGGAYDTEGNRIAGPPVRALDRFKYSIIDGRLHFIETYSVSEVVGEGAQAQIHAYGRQGPGEHVDGPEAWLYPVQPQDVEG
jgi:quinol---cytochrome c reductase iron-sulfur subunit, bacillus type